MSAKIVQICALLLVTPAVFGRPQFITFKEGKVGVNFGGYHASAGLGGLLSGNAAHGGLSASAGTPYGQQAGAGLGGSVDGHTAGGLFAGASAGGGVGASAALAGNVEAEGGGAGGSIAEAHVGGVHKSVVKVVEAAPPPPQVVAVEAPAVVQQPTLSVTKTLVASGGVESVAPQPQQPSYSYTSLVGNGGVDNIPQTDTVVYQKVKTKKKFHTRPAIVQPVVQQDIAVTQTIPTVHVQAPHPQAPAAGAAAGIDYRKFLDFGFFANTAAGFGGAAQAQPQVVVQNHHHRRLKPHHHHHKRIQYVAPVVQQQPPSVVNIHKSVYVPQPPPTVQIHKTFHAAPAVVKHPVVIARPQSSEESSESLSSDSFESHEHGKTKVVSYTSGVHGHAGGGTFFDGVFGIPIATLSAVNQFLNGKAAGGGVGFQKSVTIAKV